MRRLFSVLILSACAFVSSINLVHSSGNTPLAVEFEEVVVTPKAVPVMDPWGQNEVRPGISSVSLLIAEDPEGILQHAAVIIVGSADELDNHNSHSKSFCCGFKKPIPSLLSLLQSIVTDEGDPLDFRHPEGFLAVGFHLVPSERGMVRGHGQVKVWGVGKITEVFSPGYLSSERERMTYRRVYSRQVISEDARKIVSKGKNDNAYSERLTDEHRKKCVIFCQTGTGSCCGCGCCGHNCASYAVDLLKKGNISVPKFEWCLCCPDPRSMCISSLQSLKRKAERGDKVKYGNKNELLRRLGHVSPKCCTKKWWGSVLHCCL